MIYVCDQEIKKTVIDLCDESAQSCDSRFVRLVFKTETKGFLSTTDLTKLSTQSATAIFSREGIISHTFVYFA